MTLTHDNTLVMRHIYLIIGHTKQRIFSCKVMQGGIPIKPMLYATKNGFAEIRGYNDPEKEIDGYKIVYDSKTIPAEIMENDGDFASWVYRNEAKYLGNYHKGEKIKTVEAESIQGQNSIPNIYTIGEEAKRLLKSGMNNNGELYASAARNLGYNDVSSTEKTASIKCTLDGEPFTFNIIIGEVDDRESEAV